MPAGVRRRVRPRRRVWCRSAVRKGRRYVRALRLRWLHSVQPRASPMPYGVQPRVRRRRVSGRRHCLREAERPMRAARQGPHWSAVHTLQPPIPGAERRPHRCAQRAANRSAVHTADAVPDGPANPADRVPHRRANCHAHCVANTRADCVANTRTDFCCTDRGPPFLCANGRTNFRANGGASLLHRTVRLPRSVRAVMVHRDGAAPGGWFVVPGAKGELRGQLPWDVVRGRRPAAFDCHAHNSSAN